MFGIMCQKGPKYWNLQLEDQNPEFPLEER